MVKILGRELEVVNQYNKPWYTPPYNEHFVKL